MKPKILLSFFIITAIFLLMGNIAIAAGDPVCPEGKVCINNPLTSDDPSTIIGTVISGILGLTGVLALVAFIAGGIMWMTSGGNAEKVKKGRDILVWAVLGLFIVFTSYSILKYVFDVLL